MNKEFFKKMLFGEPIPDKGDPKYRERYEKEVEAGRRFARFACLDKAAASVQKFALEHAKAFLTIVFGFIIFSFSLNIVRIAEVLRNPGRPVTATEKLDSIMRMQGFRSIAKQFVENDSIHIQHEH